MKDCIKKNQILICIGIVVLISIAAFIIIKTDSQESTENYDRYIKNTVLMSSGDKKMFLDEGVFLTKNKQAYYEAYYLSSGYILDWNAEYEEGKLFKTLVLEESLDFIKQIFLFSEYAKAEGMELTEQELSNITASVDEFLAESGENVINATHADRELLTRVYTRTAYYDKVCNMIYSNTDLTVTDEEARQCLVAAVEISPQYFDSPKRTAEKILELVNSGEVITEVAVKYDNQAVKGNVGKGDMNGNALEELCLSLKDGECKMTEIDGTYFVVYCYMENDNEATEISRENIVTERKEEALNNFFLELLSEMPVDVNEDAWNTITFDETIFTEEDLTK